MEIEGVSATATVQSRDLFTDLFDLSTVKNSKAFDNVKTEVVTHKKAVLRGDRVVFEDEVLVVQEGPRSRSKNSASSKNNVQKKVRFNMIRGCKLDDAGIAPAMPSLRYEMRPKEYREPLRDRDKDFKAEFQNLLNSRSELRLQNLAQKEEAQTLGKSSRLKKSQSASVGVHISEAMETEAVNIKPSTMSNLSSPQEITVQSEQKELEYSVPFLETSEKFDEHCKVTVCYPIKPLSTGNLDKNNSKNASSNMTVKLGEYKYNNFKSEKDALPSLQWSPELQQYLRKHRLARFARMISETYCIIDIYGIGITGRIFVDDNTVAVPKNVSQPKEFIANNMQYFGASSSEGRMLIIEAYSIWNCQTHRICLSPRDIQQLIVVCTHTNMNSDDPNASMNDEKLFDLLRPGKKHELLETIVNLMYFQYKVEIKDPIRSTRRRGSDGESSMNTGRSNEIQREHDEVDKHKHNHEHGEHDEHNKELHSINCDSSEIDHDTKKHVQEGKHNNPESEIKVYDTNRESQADSNFSMESQLELSESQKHSDIKDNDSLGSQSMTSSRSRTRDSSQVWTVEHTSDTPLPLPDGFPRTINEIMQETSRIGRKVRDNQAHGRKSLTSVSSKAHRHENSDLSTIGAQCTSIGSNETEIIDSQSASTPTEVTANESHTHEQVTPAHSSTVDEVDGNLDNLEGRKGTANKQLLDEVTQRLSRLSLTQELRIGSFMRVNGRKLRLELLENQRIEAEKEYQRLLQQWLSTPKLRRGLVYRTVKRRNGRIILFQFFRNGTSFNGGNKNNIVLKLHEFGDCVSYRYNFGLSFLSTCVHNEVLIEYRHVSKPINEVSLETGYESKQCGESIALDMPTDKEVSTIEGDPTEIDPKNCFEVVSSKIVNEVKKWTDRDVLVAMKLVSNLIFFQTEEIGKSEENNENNNNSTNNNANITSGKSSKSKKNNDVTSSDSVSSKESKKLNRVKYLKQLSENNSNGKSKKGNITEVISRTSHSLRRKARDSVYLSVRLKDMKSSTFEAKRLLSVFEDYGLTTPSESNMEESDKNGKKIFMFQNRNATMLKTTIENVSVNQNNVPVTIKELVDCPFSNPLYRLYRLPFVFSGVEEFVPKLDASTICQAASLGRHWVTVKRKRIEAEKAEKAKLASSASVASSVSTETQAVATIIPATNETVPTSGSTKAVAPAPPRPPSRNKVEDTSAATATVSNDEVKEEDPLAKKEIVDHDNSAVTDRVYLPPVYRSGLMPSQSHWDLIKAEESCTSSITSLPAHSEPHSHHKAHKISSHEGHRRLARHVYSIDGERVIASLFLASPLDPNPIIPVFTHVQGLQIDMKTMATDRQKTIHEKILDVKTMKTVDISDPIEEFTIVETEKSNKNTDEMDVQRTETSTSDIVGTQSNDGDAKHIIIDEGLIVNSADETRKNDSALTTRNIESDGNVNETTGINNTDTSTNQENDEDADEEGVDEDDENNDYEDEDEDDENAQKTKSNQMSRKKSGVRLEENESTAEVEEDSGQDIDFEAILNNNNTKNNENSMSSIHQDNIGSNHGNAGDDLDDNLNSVDNEDMDDDVDLFGTANQDDDFGDKRSAFYDLLNPSLQLLLEVHHVTTKRCFQFKLNKSEVFSAIPLEENTLFYAIRSTYKAFYRYLNKENNRLDNEDVEYFMNLQEQCVTNQAESKEKDNDAESVLTATNSLESSVVADRTSVASRGSVSSQINNSNNNNNNSRPNTAADSENNDNNSIVSNGSFHSYANKTVESANSIDGSIQRDNDSHNDNNTGNENMDDDEHKGRARLINDLNNLYNYTRDITESEVEMVAFCWEKISKALLKRMNWRMCSFSDRMEYNRMEAMKAAELLAMEQEDNEMSKEEKMEARKRLNRERVDVATWIAYESNNNSKYQTSDIRAYPNINTCVFAKTLLISFEFAESVEDKPAQVFVHQRGDFFAVTIHSAIYGLCLSVQPSRLEQVKNTSALRCMSIDQRALHWENVITSTVRIREKIVEGQVDGNENPKEEVEQQQHPPSSPTFEIIYEEEDMEVREDSDDESTKKPADDDSMPTFEIKTDDASLYFDD